MVKSTTFFCRTAQATRLAFLRKATPKSECSALISPRCPADKSRHMRCCEAPCSGEQGSGTPVPSHDARFACYSRLLADSFLISCPSWVFRCRPGLSLAARLPSVGRSLARCAGQPGARRCSGRGPASPADPRYHGPPEPVPTEEAASPAGPWPRSLAPPGRAVPGPLRFGLCHAPGASAGSGDFGQSRRAPPGRS